MYINPGQDISLLSYAEQCKIVCEAAADTEWLDTLSESKRQEICRAAGDLSKAKTMRLRFAILAIRNHETALAAENGEYNEWRQYERQVLDDDRHLRPIMAALRIVALGGIIPTVWTCGRIGPNEPPLMRAIVRLGAKDIKIAEFWHNPTRRTGYPDLEVFELEDEME